MSSTQAGALPFPRFLALIAAERPDLSSAFDLTTFIGQLACLSWWEEHGHREYARIKWSPAPVGGAMLEPAEPVSDDGLQVPRFISLIINERPDLQSSFNLRSFTGRLSCLSWWLEHGQLQYRAIKWVPPTAPRTLTDMHEDDSQQGLPLPLFLRLILKERADLHALCPLDSFIGRLKARSWWLEHGQFEYPALRWVAPPMPAELFEMEAGQRCSLPLLPRFLNLIWNERPDLQAAFDLDRFSARLSYQSWW